MVTKPITIFEPNIPSTYSQFGKMIRIDTKTIRAAGRATQGVRLLTLEIDDKVAAAVIIPPEELKDDEPLLIQ